MKTGRFFLILASAIFIDCLLLGTAFAGFGFGGDNEGKSGLDFSTGYDINTVATLSGKVRTLPDPNDGEHAIIGISANGERFYLYVGPSSYWEKSGISVRINDKISAKGSIAQGRDGRVYMLAQKLTNLTTGGRLALRGESGEPLWSGRNSNNARHGGFFFGWGGGRSGLTGMGRGMMGMGRGMMGR
jgi:hypothetical protein